MTGRELRERDPLYLQAVRARLARIKVAIAAKETRELRERWPDDNIVEAVYLRRRREEGRQDDGAGHGDA